MASSKRLPSSPYVGKGALLPPKSPFSNASSSYSACPPNSFEGSKLVSKHGDGYIYHHRTSSESVILEEQPSWLDDLLNEPDTPVHKIGHRRSSSDSFAHVDIANFSGVDYSTQDDCKFRSGVSVSSWASHSDNSLDWRNTYFQQDQSSRRIEKNAAWAPPFFPKSYLNSHVSTKGGVPVQTSGASHTPRESDLCTPSTSMKQDYIESGMSDPEKNEVSFARSLSSEADTKRAKQQFAQRSRVRKLQYIAELERNVQALQAKGSGFSAEIEFVNQQHLILSMENTALKQRLDSLSQEHLIKFVEQEVLEREIGRLRTLHQNQQQQQQQTVMKGPRNMNRIQAPNTVSHSRGDDLRSQLLRLSLKEGGDGP